MPEYLYCFGIGLISIYLLIAFIHIYSKQLN